MGWTGSSGSQPHRIHVSGLGVVGGWGRLSPNCWWVHLMGVLFPWMVGLSSVWWLGVGVPARILRTV